MRNNKHLKTLILSAIFAAAIFVATAYLPKIPLGTGYAHIGDSIIYLAASILPLPAAVACAAVGASLADILTGYAHYAIFSLIVKAVLALFFTSKGKKLLVARNIIAVVICLAVTPAGYFLADTILYGPAGAVVNILGNFLQALVSGVIYLVAAACLDKAKIIKKASV